jgi:hypothetical protein
MINPLNSIASLVVSAPKERKLDLGIRVHRDYRREGNKVTYTYKINGQKAPRWKYCKLLRESKRYSKLIGRMAPECRRRRRRKKKPVKVEQRPRDELQRSRESLRKRGIKLPPKDKKEVSKSNKKGGSEGVWGFIEENWLAGLVWAMAIGAVGVTWWLLRKGGSDDDKTPPPPPVNPLSPAGRNSVMSTSVDASARRSVTQLISAVMPGLPIGQMIFPRNLLNNMPMRGLK